MTSRPGPPRAEATTDLAAAIEPVLATDRRIQAVYLFGSRARNDAAESSDVDLGVLFAETVGLRDVVLLESQLEETLGTNVDLVDLASCRTFLAVEIIDGERIYCTDARICDEFELYVMRKAGDLAPFERARRESLLGPSEIPA